METTMTVRAKAFAGRGVETVRVMVDGDTVYVWDSVAAHYTLCHSLSESAKRRIRRLAAKAA